MRTRLGLLAACAVVTSIEACKAFTSDASDVGSRTASADGGPTDGRAPEPSARRWCDGRDASFCADFDGVSVAEGWTESGEPLGGSLVAIDGDASTALRASTLASPGGAVAAALEKQLSTTANRVTVAFDLRIV